MKCRIAVSPGINAAGYRPPNYKDSPDIKWNFTKFLINKKGQVVARFEPTEDSETIAKEIEKIL